MNKYKETHTSLIDTFSTIAFFIPLASLLFFTITKAFNSRIFKYESITKSALLFKSITEFGCMAYLLVLFIYIPFQDQKYSLSHFHTYSTSIIVTYALIVSVYITDMYILFEDARDGFWSRLTGAPHLCCFWLGFVWIKFVNVNTWESLDLLILITFFFFLIHASLNAFPNLTVLLNLCKQPSKSRPLPPTVHFLTSFTWFCIPILQVLVDLLLFSLDSYFIFNLTNSKKIGNVGLVWIVLQFLGISALLVGEIRKAMVIYKLGKREIDHDDVEKGNK